MPPDRAQPHRPQQPSTPGAPPPPGVDNGSSNTNNSVAGTYFLGRYRVVDEIGIGGMASVHLARMDGPGGFQKWVAIKRIHPHLVEDDSFVHMFLDEARIAARISHPNVASVFELGKHEDTYWIAMEYLHGEPLREVMRRTEEMGQPMPPEIACRVIADAAEGLHAAHELLGKNGEKLQLVHRDVTPHNLFVTYDGTTKVVDFGIAKFSSRMASTRAGTLKGKLAYMSPEQVAGEQIDRRTDLFALGVVLWELTTGQRLFRMESDLDTLAKVQECNVPRPSAVVRGYPIDLEKIVMKALAKNKNERYRTAREFSRALQSLLMRRGLFIASDEVASYVQAIFVDRIRKREEHLRWAAEVTQTINIEGKLEPSPREGGGGSGGGNWGNEPSIVTFNSEVQPSPQAPRTAPPRPAAGAPPAPQTSQASFAQSFSHQSATTNPRPGALSETARPPPRTAVPAPPPASSPAARPPNLRATQETAAAAPKSKAPGAARHPAVEEPPTLRASPRAREEMLEMAMAAATTAPRAPTLKPAPPVAAPPPVGAELSDLDEGDDNDDTIITSTRPDFSQEAPADRSSGPLPAAGRPPPPSPIGRPSTAPASFAAPPRSVPPRVPTAPPLPAVVVPPAVIEMGPQGGLDQTRTAIGDSPFHAQTMPPGAPLLQRSGSMSGELPDPLAAARPHATAEVGRLFAPPPRPSQRTITAAAFRRYNVPLWAVAAGSAALALLTFGILLFILSRVGGSKPTAATASTSASAPPIAAPAGDPNPFAAARHDFEQRFPSPTSLAVPGDPQPVAPTAPAAPAPSEPSQATKPTATVVAAKPAPAPPTDTTSTDPAGSAYGTLTVYCRPTCDSVLDNGSSLGPSPVDHRKVSVGARQVTLNWGTGKKKVLSAIVVADQDARVVGNWP